MHLPSLPSEPYVANPVLVSTLNIVHGHLSPMDLVMTETAKGKASNVAVLFLLSVSIFPLVLCFIFLLSFFLSLCPSSSVLSLCSSFSLVYFPLCPSSSVFLPPWPSSSPYFFLLVLFLFLVSSSSAFSHACWQKLDGGLVNRLVV